MTKRPPVSVIGLGKLGACIAACFADKGFIVIGADVSARTVDLVNKGQAPVSEPQLAEMIGRAHSRLRATQDIADAIKSSDATFIVVPTPSTDGRCAPSCSLCISVGNWMVTGVASPLSVLPTSSAPAVWQVRHRLTSR